MNSFSWEPLVDNMNLIMSFALCVSFSQMFCHVGMKPIRCILLVVFALEVCSGKKIHHGAPTYFQRKNPDGSLVDRSKEDEFNSQVVCKKEAYLSRGSGNSTIHVDPQVIKNGQSVTITWNIHSSVTFKDWIGIYCPNQVSAPQTLDYFNVAVSPTWQLGYGSYSMRLYNLRVDCAFRYYTRLSETECQLLAQSPVLNFEGGYEMPLQGHIALGNSASEMRVMWVSGTEATPVVYYGLSPNALLLKAYGKSASYNASHMCEAPAATSGFIDPGLIHDVLLTGLLSNRRYFYRFGSALGMSDVFNFTTALPPGDATPFVFLTYGDHGVSTDRMSPGADRTAANILKEYEQNDVRLIFHHGDISYAVGYAYIWDQWAALVEPYTSLIPYMVGIGNHEQDHMHGGPKDPSGAPGEGGFHPDWGNFGSDSGGECGVPMYHRFHMPDNGNALWWYSFDYGLVHFVMMSTEHNYTQGSVQYNWLANDLKSVDRKKTPWLVIGGHRPMYTTQDQPDDVLVSEHMQQLFEDLLYTYRVDVAFWSHVHSYQRTCKMYKKECRSDGVVHVVVGSAGRTLDPQWFGTQEWAVFKTIAFGYGRVTVANATHMLYEFVDNAERQTIDSVWLVK